MRQLILSISIVLFTAATLLAQDVKVRPSINQISGEEVEARTSPMASAWLVNGDKYARVIYNQPSLRGRKMLGGDAVPYGKLWRLGANESTEIFLNKKTKINGNKLKAGAYTMYAIPNQKSWTVIFSSGHGLLGTNGYDKANDVLSVTVPVKEAPKKFETFFIWFDDDGSNMNMAWDMTWVTIPVEF